MLGAGINPGSKVEIHSECQDLKLLMPVPQWSITRGDVNLTRMTIFRIRLLVGCHGLECDAALFRSRSTSVLRSQDPSCKLCGAPCEDALHFVSSLATARLSLFSSAPPPVALLLPDPVFRSSVSVSCSCKNCMTLVLLCCLPSNFGLIDNSPFAEAIK